jgi:hypothetical protein
MRSKRITLKSLPETAKGKGDAISYKDFLVHHFGSAGAQGVTIAQIRTKLGLIKSLEQATDTWDISVSEFDLLVKQLEVERWAGVSENIVLFMDDIRNSPDALGELVPISG